ncbi:HIT-like protein [Neoconidiobolus thromboides FSU 785]|nr:HIT-like protein [Neoconidiobolus thromboides FSU 785]
MKKKKQVGLFFEKDHKTLEKMQPLTITNVKELIFNKYKLALNCNKLFYYPSIDYSLSKKNLIQYQIRLVPALKKKIEKGEESFNKKEPTNPVKSTFKNTNPFLPCDPDLLISDTLYPNHNLVLNKFCVVPGHILLTTKEYESQDIPLNVVDFEALIDLMVNYGPDKLLAFFNCGKNSGASQPHKHIQLIPLSINEPPIKYSLDKLMRDLEHGTIAYKIYELSDLPYSHRIVKLSDSVSNTSPTTIFNFYNLMIQQLKSDSMLHHNLTLFNNYIYVLPRKEAHFILENEIFSINSLGSVHMIMAKDETQLNLLKEEIGSSNLESWAGSWVGFKKE